MAHVLRVLYE